MSALSKSNVTLNQIVGIHYSGILNQKVMQHTSLRNQKPICVHATPITKGTLNSQFIWKVRIPSLSQAIQPNTKKVIL